MCDACAQCCLRHGKLHMSRSQRPLASVRDTWPQCYPEGVAGLTSLSDRILWQVSTMCSCRMGMAQGGTRKIIRFACLERSFLLVQAWWSPTL